MVLTLDEPAPPQVMEQVAAIPGIDAAFSVTL